MENEIKDSKMKMRNFKLNKFFIMLNSLVLRQHRTHKYHSFSQLQSHMLELNLKYKKLRCHSHFNQKQKILRLWHSDVKSKQLHRKLQQEEQERQRTLLLENKADRAKYLTLLKTGFRSLSRYALTRKSEKQIEAEHEARKNQID